MLDRGLHAVVTTVETKNKHKHTHTQVCDRGEDDAAGERGGGWMQYSVYGAHRHQLGTC